MKRILREACQGEVISRRCFERLSRLLKTGHFAVEGQISGEDREEFWKLIGGCREELKKDAERLNRSVSEGRSLS
jgi:ketosteroid isomerase-like protein